MKKGYDSQTEREGGRNRLNRKRKDHNKRYFMIERKQYRLDRYRQIDRQRGGEINRDQKGGEGGREEHKTKGQHKKKERERGREAGREREGGKEIVG